MDEVLPWEHIKSGIRKSFLKQEWERALKGKVTPDCREKCLECGVCDHKKIDPIFHKDWAPSFVKEKIFLNQMPSVIKRYRITFSKTDTAKYLSHLELARLFIRAFKRAGLKLVFSKGYHPMPKVSFAAALPVGTESFHETVDIELYEGIPMPLLKDSINQQLPSGIRVTLLEDITKQKKGIRLIETHFLINLNGIKIEKAQIENFLNTDHFPISKEDKKGVKDVNARPLVKSMSFIPPYSINLIIKHAHGPELKPIDIIKGVFHLSDHHVSGIKILKTEQVMG